MRKMDSNVIKQFEKVSGLNFALTVVENIVFLMLKKWDYTVLLGSLWGFVIACVFFYLICTSVTKALESEDPEIASKYMRATYIERMLVMAGGIIVALKVSVFNWIAAVIPLLFTRLSITLLHNKIVEEE